MSFENLGLSQPLMQALDEKNYTVATPIQQQAIPLVLQGRDLLGIAQTGTGKTAAFMLPSIDNLREAERQTPFKSCRMLADLLAYSLADVREVISNGRTFDYEETVALTTGHTLWSNRSNPMLWIVEDTVGRHDFLLTPCSEATFRHFYADKPVHRGCFGNLAEALAPWGIEPDAIPCAFNVFMNVPVARDGSLRVDPPVSKAGDRIVLEAAMDCIIGLTACSAYASNGGTFKPIDWRIDG